MFLRYFPVLRRFYSTVIHEYAPAIAIVGAGPAGFYSATRILRSVPNANIHFFEAAPFPFGLVRAGVAPDHPEVKNVEHEFTRLMDKHRQQIRFFGNVPLVDHNNNRHGIDFQLLRKHYNAVLLSFGASLTKSPSLGIPGEDNANVVSGREIVAWYNGDFMRLPQDFDLDLSKIRRVSIIGAGNVALDVARILLLPTANLRTTDIDQKALSILEKSKVQHVDVIARRGPMEVCALPYWLT